MSGAISQPIDGAAARIRVQEQWWVLIVAGILAAAIVIGNFWFLNFVHVFTGMLWTGTDIFMGFVLGPVMRRLDVPARRALTIRLMPRMLFYMPTMAIVTSTSGWVMASQFGFFDVDFPDRWWLVAAGVLVLLLTIQGFGILLPTNLRVYFEMRKDRPDAQKVQRWMRTYVRFVAVQGVLQVLLIGVMAKLATGL